MRMQFRVMSTDEAWRRLFWYQSARWFERGALDGATWCVVPR